MIKQTVTVRLYGADVDVEVTIDLAELARCLGLKAVDNSRGKSVLASGVVKAQVTLAACLQVKAMRKARRCEVKALRKLQSSTLGN